VEENEAKEDARVPRILRIAQPADDAAPRAAMRRCQACSGAHNLAIAARLASPGALPDSTMLAASTGCFGRRVSELASLKPACGEPSADKQADTLFPTSSPMLGAGQREFKP